ncbi:30S ribosomal protein S20 [Candidatus Saccharibacteria bacterium]|nr:30S ribosomal protein S20 [Candidatus Saccharibacteria bacterium]
MPIIKSATKRMKQDKRRYAQNLRTKRAMRTAVKEFEAKPSFEAFRAAQSAIDTAVKKNVLTRQAAARRISHLSAAAKAAGVKVVAVKKAAPAKTVKPTSTKTAASKKATEKPATKAPAKKLAAKK